jgi:hypothetical protein
MYDVDQFESKLISMKCPIFKKKRYNHYLITISTLFQPYFKII